jgi:uncharacterized protein involved in exopolysaccharide biosynthesis
VALAAGILLLARKSYPRAPFLVPSLFAFLLVFGAGSFITAILPNSFLSTARIKLTPNTPEPVSTDGGRTTTGSYDSYRIQTELEVIQSEVVLDGVIEGLDLSRKWGRRFGEGHALKHSEALTLLRQRLDLRPVRNASIIEIRVYDDRAEEAAKIANEVARVYANRAAGSDSGASSPGALQVEVIDQAMAAFRPTRPNRLLNLVLAALAGLLVGGVAGAMGAARSGRRQPA